MSTWRVIGLGTFRALDPVLWTTPFFFTIAASTVLGLKACFFVAGDITSWIVSLPAVVWLTSADSLID